MFVIGCAAAEDRAGDLGAGAGGDECPPAARRKAAKVTVTHAPIEANLILHFANIEITF